MNKSPTMMCLFLNKLPTMMCLAKKKKKKGGGGGGRKKRSRLVLQATPTPTPQRRRDAPRLAINYTDITEAPAARVRNQKAQRPSSLRPHFNPLPAPPHLLISSPIGQSGVNTAPGKRGADNSVAALSRYSPDPAECGWE